MHPKLRDVIARALQVAPERVTPELRQNDVAAWDSQGHLELVMSVESAFDVEFELAEVTAMRSVADVASALRRREAIV